VKKSLVIKLRRRNKVARKTHRIKSILPRMTVGVMGSSGGMIASEVTKKVYKLGREIARRRHVLITGACPGLPHEAVKGAKSVGCTVVGVSPALNFEEHVVKFKSPVRGYDALIYTGSGLMGREIENIRSCDVVVFVGGRSGTLGEFAIAYDEGKVIGILEKTGGITEHLKTIVSFVRKETKAILVSSPDPEDLLDRLEQVYKSRLLPNYKSLMAHRDPDGVTEN
jgi:uncharacterized protein (TIGR00725 family)